MCCRQIRGKNTHHPMTPRSMDTQSYKPLTYSNNVNWPLNSEATLRPVVDVALSVDRPLSGVCSCFVGRPRRPRPRWLDAALVFVLDTSILLPTPLLCGVDGYNCFLLLLAATTNITTVLRLLHKHHNTACAIDSNLSTSYSHWRNTHSYKNVVKYLD